MGLPVGDAEGTRGCIRCQDERLALSLRRAFITKSKVYRPKRFERLSFCGPSGSRSLVVTGLRMGLFYFNMTSMTVVVCVTPSPVAVIVILWFPTKAFLLTLTVMIELPDPGAAMELGLKVTVCRPPSPVADKEIAESKPPDTKVVIVELPEPGLATLIVAGDALRVKPLDVVPLTVSKTVAVSVVPPDFPFTVTV